MNAINNEAQNNKMEEEIMMNRNNNNSNSNTEAMAAISAENNRKEEEVMTTSFKKTSNAAADDIITDISSPAIINDLADKNLKIPDEEVLENFNDLIPEDEQAVAEMHVQDDSPITVVNIIKPLDDMTSEIPEEELEDTTEEIPVEMNDAKACGCFDPALGMAGFSLNTGQTIFMNICDDSEGKRSIVYRQKYQDGSFSDKMTIKQSDLIMATHYSSKKNENVSFRNQVNKFMISASREYLDKIKFPNEALPIASILRLMVSNYLTIPVESETVTTILDQPERLYPAVINIIKRIMGHDEEHEAYYALDKSNINYIAENLNVAPKKLLKKMKEYHFLYFTESSVGYQTCVRFKPDGDFYKETFTEWCYCVLRLDYLAKRKLQKEQAKKLTKKSFCFKCFKFFDKFKTAIDKREWSKLPFPELNERRKGTWKRKVKKH